MQDYTAIAIGTGPSFYDWIKTPIVEPKPKLYGCGVVPLYINGLTAYGYGDITHVNNIPDPDGQFHPGCRCYAGTRNFHDKPGLFLYSDLDLPHGNSSGGMALSMACLSHDVVAIVGFDGTRSSLPHLSDAAYYEFIFNFRYLITYWQNRGRRIISLMPESVFNQIIEPVLVPMICLPPI